MGNEELKPKYEDIIYKIDAEGLDYWLSDYAKPGAIEEFDPWFAHLVLEAKRTMSSLEDYVMDIKEKFEIGEI